MTWSTASPASTLATAPLMSPRPLPEPALASADPRWAALRARDPNADGSFVYSVRTTGVYCRPSCAPNKRS